MGVKRGPRPLGELVEALGTERVEAPDGAGPTVESIVDDSREAGAGSLFVAIGGTHEDGHAHIADAVARGAVAVVAERAVEDPGVPVVRVRNARRALAVLAAEWYGRPADRLRLVGVTGTVGKTTVVAMLEAILARAGRRPGVIGSLGVGWGEDRRDTGMTTPGPLALHAALAEIEEHADTALLEVTSHSLVQERVHGLHFELGIFTNLVMLEHLEYHESFQGYVRAKSRFFEHLDEGRPLIHPAGDRLLSALVEEKPVRAVACGSGTDVALHIERTAMTSQGTRLLFQIEQPYPRIDGSFVEPMTFPAALRLLGRAAINNASLAAAAALALCVDAETIAHALAELEPPRRRMQVSRIGGITVLDDTVGHPDSITGAFEVAEVVPHERLLVVYAVRGRRGEDINRRDAEAVAIWTRRIPVEHLIITDAADATDDLNTVTEAERAAFIDGLGDAEMSHDHRVTLDDAIGAVVEHARAGDLVMLLGAQGMNDGAERLRRQLARV